MPLRVPIVWNKQLQFVHSYHISLWFWYMNFMIPSAHFPSAAISYLQYILAHHHIYCGNIRTGVTHANLSSLAYLSPFPTRPQNLFHLALALSPSTPHTISPIHLSALKQNATNLSWYIICHVAIFPHPISHSLLPAPHIFINFTSLQITFTRYHLHLPSMMSL